MKLDPGCIPIDLNNRAALFLIEDPVSAARTKHIDVVYHHVREKVKHGQCWVAPTSGHLSCVSLVYTSLRHLGLSFAWVFPEASIVNYVTTPTIRWHLSPFQLS
jgi:hypothetical protein